MYSVVPEPAACPQPGNTSPNLCRIRGKVIPTGPIFNLTNVTYSFTTTVDIMAFPLLVFCLWFSPDASLTVEILILK